MLKEEPIADEDNVNLTGTSNGAALIYRMIIGTHADRPFRRWKILNLDFYDNLSLLGFFLWYPPCCLYNGMTESFGTRRTPRTIITQFQKSSSSLTTLNISTSMALRTPSSQYDGQDPGPSFLGENVHVLSAQKSKSVNKSDCNHNI